MQIVVVVNTSMDNIQPYQAGWFSSFVVRLHIYLLSLELQHVRLNDKENYLPTKWDWFFHLTFCCFWIIIFLFYLVHVVISYSKHLRTVFMVGAQFPEVKCVPTMKRVNRKTISKYIVCVIVFQLTSIRFLCLLLWFIVLENASHHYR